MLPFLRVLPAAALALAVAILLLALTPPDGARTALHRVAIDARGPLQHPDEHPEWRQFFMMAAFRRAEAVDRLRELPSAPTRLPEIVLPLPELPPITIAPAAAAPPAPPAAPPTAEAPAEPQHLAGLPLERRASDPAPEEVTGSIEEAPGATIPVEIGEASSTELPIVLPQKRPPILRHPLRQKSSKPAKPKRRLAHAKRPAKPPREKQTGLFDVWFGGDKAAAKPPAQAAQ
jgi:hypothetical protein